MHGHSEYDTGEDVRKEFTMDTDDAPLSSATQKFGMPRQ